MGPQHVKETRTHETWKIALSISSVCALFAGIVAALWAYASPQGVKQLREIVLLISSVCALFGGMVAGLWAYAKFILERGFLPAIQFDVDLRKVGQAGAKLLVEIGLQIKNLGPSTLVARNIRLDVLYLVKGLEDLNTYLTKEGENTGRTAFERKLWKKPEINTANMKPVKVVIEGGTKKEKEVAAVETRGILILKYDTFVQPGVDQRYPFVTTLPVDAEYALVWGSFEYAQKPSPFQERVLALARLAGLVQYSLGHIHRPHTVERVFTLND